MSLDLRMIGGFIRELKQNKRMCRENYLFYVIKPSVATSETGPVFPQVQKMTNGYDYNSVNSVYQLSKFVQELPNFTPDLDSFFLNNKARITDVLSNSLTNNTGIIISKKLNDILGQLDLLGCSTFPATVYYKTKIYSYFWLHVKAINVENIDFVKSIFIVMQNYAYKIDTIQICSFQDYLDKKNSLKKLNPNKNITIWAEKITLNSNFNFKTDIFRIGNFDTDIYISERLKLILEKKEISGIEITNADRIFF